ncbi:MAG TPA: M20/M25/M40 family metallo-hydrolase [Thermoanaerobaculia bacterium]|nr:M20/M25/M40 family metallo-hydrolase [Thermoanaerobaculia bacterium]
MTPARRRILLFAILGVLAAAVLALRFWNQREQARRTAGVFVPKEIAITPEMLLLQEYVRIDTSNPPGKELPGAQWLAAQLRKRGIEAEIIESVPGRANVYARIPGKQRGEGLLLLNHIDVVPAVPSQWGQAPFGGRIHRNLMLGRGTLDMKSIAVCELLAMADVARAGRPPEHDVVFLAVADEEQGSRFGMQWLLEHRADVVDGVRYVINEGGATEVLAERLHYVGVEVGSKLLVVATLQAREREQLQRARIALEPYFDSDEPDRVLPAVRHYLADVAPQRLENRELLADAEHTVAIGKFWLLPRSIRELMQNVVWPTGIERAADGFTMKAFLFNLPDEDGAVRVEWLRRTVAPFGVTVAGFDGTLGPVPFSSPDTPLFGIIRRQMQRVYGPVAVGTHVLPSSMTDCRFLRKRGIDCYGIYPFPVDVLQTRGVHGTNEMIRLDWFGQGVAAMGGMVREYAFGG